MSAVKMKPSNTPTHPFEAFEAGRKTKLDGIVLKERVNKRFVANVLMSNIINELAVHYTSADLYDSLKAQIAAYYNKIGDDTVSVEYNQCAYGYGRVYPQYSLSMCSIRRELRHAFVAESGEDTYVDVDLKAAHHVILLQLVDYFKVKYDSWCPSGYSQEQKQAWPSNLRRYVNDREHWLGQVMEAYQVDRDAAKNLFIIILYNGGWSTWADKHGVTLPMADELVEFQREFRAVCKFMLETVNKAWYEKMKKDHPKDNKSKELGKGRSKKRKMEGNEEQEADDDVKHENNLGRFMSIYLQEWERRCLEAMYDYSVTNGLIKDSNCVLCFDGLMLEKKWFRKSDLKKMEEAVLQKTGLHVILETKSFNEGQEVIKQVKVEPPSSEELQRFTRPYFKKLRVYEEQKDYFEQFFAKIADQNGGYIQMHKNRIEEDAGDVRKMRQELSTIFHNKELSGFSQFNTVRFSVTKNKDTNKYACVERKEKFIDVWKKDEDLREYQTVDFIPRNKTESEIKSERLTDQHIDYLNLFTGYHDCIKKIELPKTPDGKVDESKIKRRVALWIDIVKNLCECETNENGETIGETKEEKSAKEQGYEFYVSWLGQHISDPQNRTGISVIMQGQQGTAKNLHFLPIKLMVGMRHVLETSSMSDLFGEHAEGFKNKLFAVLNEIEGKDTIDFEGQLKSITTEDTKVINAKFQAPVTLMNFLALLLTSNKMNCIKVDVMSGNRRWSAFRATSKYAYCSGRYNKKQWASIREDWSSPEFIAALYYYLTAIIDWKSILTSEIPKTTALDALIRHSQSTVSFWFDSFLREKVMNYRNIKQAHSVEREKKTDEELLQNQRYEEQARGYDKPAKELYREYREWCSKHHNEEGLGLLKWTNAMKDMNVGLEFEKNDNNSNQVKFEYEQIYESLRSRYNTSKYEKVVDTCGTTGEKAVAELDFGKW